MALPFARLPRHAPGMRIGLLGGSFNPPHGAHLLASRTALRRLGLDRVWWLVTPGNPLKDNARLPTLAVRMEAARRVAADPRIDVTDIEAALGTPYTYDTLAWLRRRCPGVRFVWLMGADNLASLHRWRKWRGIAGLMPMAVIDRPGSTLRATRAPAASRLAFHRAPERMAKMLPEKSAPAWIFLHGPRSTLSSTQLRESGGGLKASP